MYFLLFLLSAEAMEMLKNLKPDDIKAAITNMPQEMKDMMKGMGMHLLI
jgi:hypothetical protein